MLQNLKLVRKYFHQIMAANADNLLFLQPHNYRINIRVRSANFLSSISFFFDYE